jgi:hypothetical protein
VKYQFHHDERAISDEGDELSIQVRLKSRLRILAPGVRVVATPNAGKRTAWAAMKAKAEGMAAGWPDLTILWSNGAGVNPVPGIAFLEMKARDGALSVPQIDTLNFLHNAGFHCGCFRSVDSAIEFLRQAGAPFMLAKAA